MPFGLQIRKDGRFLSVGAGLVPARPIEGNHKGYPYKIPE